MHGAFLMQLADVVMAGSWSRLGKNTKDDRAFRGAHCEMHRRQRLKAKVTRTDNRPREVVVAHPGLRRRGSLWGCN